MVACFLHIGNKIVIFKISLYHILDGFSKFMFNNEKITAYFDETFQFKYKIPSSSLVMT